MFNEFCLNIERNDNDIIYRKNKGLIPLYTNLNSERYDLHKNKIDITFSELEFVQIVASGTSYHSGLVAKRWIEDILSIPCSVVNTSEYIETRFLKRKNSILIVIDGDENNLELLQVLLQSKKEHRYDSYFVISVFDTDLINKNCDKTFHIKPEFTGFKNPFANEIYSLFSIILEIAYVKNLISKEKIEQLFDEINNYNHNSIIYKNIKEEMENINNDLRNKDFVFIARNNLFPLTKELSHQFKEKTNKHSYAVNIGELKYLNNRLNKKNEVFVALGTCDRYFDELECDLSFILEKNKDIIFFSDADIKREHITTLKLPQCKNMLAPFLYNIPMQIFIDCLSKKEYIN